MSLFATLCILFWRVFLFCRLLCPHYFLACTFGTWSHGGPVVLFCICPFLFFRIFVFLLLLLHCHIVHGPRAMRFICIRGKYVSWYELLRGIRCVRVSMFVFNISQQICQKNIAIYGSYRQTENAILMGQPRYAHQWYCFYTKSR